MESIEARKFWSKFNRDSVIPAKETIIPPAYSNRRDLPSRTLHARIFQSSRVSRTCSIYAIGGASGGNGANPIRSIECPPRARYRVTFRLPRSSENGPGIRGRAYDVEGKTFLERFDPEAAWHLADECRSARGADRALTWIRVRWRRDSASSAPV